MSGTETTQPVSQPDVTVTSRCWSINRQLLPLKLFYFFFYGACGTVIPFIPVYLKYLNITASEIGIITGGSVFLCIFTRPAFGLVADKLNVRKLALIFSCLVFGSTFFSMWFIPGRPLAVVPVDVSVNDDFLWLCPDHVTAGNSSCHYDFKGHSKCFYSSTSLKEREIQQNKIDAYEETNGNSSFHSLEEIQPPLHCYYVILANATNTSSIYHLHATNTSSIYHLHATNTSSIYHLHALRVSSRHDIKRNVSSRDESESCLWNCSKISNSFITKFGKEVIIRRANSESEKLHVSLDIVFVVSFALLAVSRAFYSSSTSLVDAVAYTILGNNRLKWGEQRLWGTIGTAFAVVSVTTLNDRVKWSNYTGLFCMCLLWTCLACVVGIVKLKCDSIPKNERFLQDMWSVLKSGAVRFYFCKLLLFGMLCGAAQNFFLWFVSDIGGNQINLGLLLLVNCFSSIILLRCTRKLLGLVGQQRAMQFALCCYAVRYLAFSLIPSAWFALPIEVLHGVTYSMFWAAASSTASLVAPPGTQATCQGLAGAIYWDMGRGLGTLVTGQLIQLMGARATFRYYSIACGAMLPLCCLFDHIWTLNKTQNVRTVESVSVEASEVDPEQNSSASGKLLEDQVKQRYDEHNNEDTQNLTPDISVTNGETKLQIQDEEEIHSANVRNQNGPQKMDMTSTSIEYSFELDGSGADITAPLLENQHKDVLNNESSQTYNVSSKMTPRSDVLETAIPVSFQITTETEKVGENIINSNNSNNCNHAASQNHNDSVEQTQARRIEIVLDNERSGGHEEQKQVCDLTPPTPEPAGNNEISKTGIVDQQSNSAFLESSSTTNEVQKTVNYAGSGSGSSSGSGGGKGIRITIVPTNKSNTTV